MVGGGVLLAVAGLAVRRLRSLWFKRLKISQALVLPTMIVVAIFTALAMTEPWATLLLVLMVYLASIPLSISTHRRLQQQRPLATSATVASDEADADRF
jgi:CDP-diacylglycerol--serine O-phosphatidyltransferase